MSYDDSASYFDGYSDQHYDDESGYHLCDCSSHPEHHHEHHEALTVNFYDYLIKVIESQLTFDDKIFNVDFDRCVTQKPSATTVAKLLELIRNNGHNCEVETRLKYVKALVCWEAQFGDVTALERISEIRDSIGNPAKLGDYVTESKSAGTLLYAIHSRSLDTVRYLVESSGTPVNTIFSNGLNGVHYSIIKNYSDIARYLLDKYAEIYDHHVIDVLEENGMVMTPLDLAIDKTHLECIQVLVNFYSKYTNYRPNLKQMSEIFKCISDKTACDTTQKEAKYQICKLLFERFEADITSEIRRFPMNTENLFSLCCEGASQKMLELLYVFLSSQVKSAQVVQKTLVDTFLRKISKSFEFNFEVIRSMLALINDKKLLYESLVQSDKYRVIQPSDHDLKTAVFKPPDKTYAKSITNAFFIKQQMLVKYDIVPENKRLDWMAAFMFQWLVKCFGKRPFISACSIIRYLSFDDCLQLTSAYYDYLLTNAYVDLAPIIDQAWFSDICVHLDAESRQRLTERFSEVYQSHRVKTPFSLKALSRNRIRNLLPSLSRVHIGQLDLPQNLSEYLYS